MKKYPKKQRKFVDDLKAWSRQQKKEVRRHLAHEVILGAIPLAEGAREGLFGVLGPHSGLLGGARNSFF